MMDAQVIMSFRLQPSLREEVARLRVGLIAECQKAHASMMRMDGDAKFDLLAEVKQSLERAGIPFECDTALKSTDGGYILDFADPKNNVAFQASFADVALAKTGLQVCLE
jgi:hypothetical protein